MENSLMRLIEPEVHLWGTEFSPKELSKIENIEFRSATELGEIMTRGRYKGKQSPYGSCQLLVPKYVDLKDSIFWMAEFIFVNKPKFEEAGATDISMWVYWQGIQGNMAFTPKEIKMISKLNVNLCIDYTQIDTEEYNKLNE